VLAAANKALLNKTLAETMRISTRLLITGWLVLINDRQLLIWRDFSISTLEIEWNQRGFQMKYQLLPMIF
jgi:hypothetical protein